MQRIAATFRNTRQKLPSETGASYETGYSSREAQRYNWKPWQTNPFLIGSLLVLAIAVVAVLEYLTQESAKTVTSSQLQDIWLEWYRGTTDNHANLFEGQSMLFHNTSSCLDGLLELDNVSSTNYFLWVYVPSIVAVLLSLLWGIVDDEVKRMEPFYQASLPRGTKGSESIFAEYISLPSFLSPIQAYHWRQWTVLLSSICYVLLATITPILQTQIFQTQYQVLQVGFIDNYDSSFQSFDPADPSTLSRYDEDEHGPVFGVCWQVGQDDAWNTWLSLVTLGNVIHQDEGVPYDHGAVRGVVYTDPIVTRIQEAVLVLSVLLGIGLVWRVVTRKSGMSCSFGSFASLTALAAANPDFIRSFAKLASFDQSEAVACKTHLRAQNIQLGNLYNGSSYAYSFFFTNPAQASQTPVNASPAQYRSPRHSQRLMWTFFLIVYVILSLIVWPLTNGALGSRVGLLNQVDDQNLVFLSLMPLVLTSVTKSIWKSLEHAMIAANPFRYRHDIVRRDNRRVKLSVPRLRATPALGREYSRLPVGWITIRAFLDGQIFLGVITTISLCLELSILFFSFAASMSQGLGYNSQDLTRVSWVSAGFIGLAFFLSFFTTRGAALTAVPPMFGIPGSIAHTLAYCAASTGLHHDLRPVGNMRRNQDEMHFLQNLNALYGLGKIKTPLVRAGVVWGLERTELLADYRPQQTIEELAASGAIRLNKVGSGTVTAVSGPAENQTLLQPSGPWSPAQPTQASNIVNPPPQNSAYLTPQSAAYVAQQHYTTHNPQSAIPSVAQQPFANVQPQPVQAASWQAVPNANFEHRYY